MGNNTGSGGGRAVGEDGTEAEEGTPTGMDGVHASTSTTAKGGNAFCFGEGKAAAAARRRHQWASSTFPRSKSANIAPHSTLNQAEGAVKPGVGSGHVTIAGNYRRYYPKEVRQRSVANQFFRSPSQQSSASEAPRPASSHGSPLPKKPRTNSSFLSLSSCPEFKTSSTTGAIFEDRRHNNAFLLGLAKTGHNGVLLEEPTPRSDGETDDGDDESSAALASRGEDNSLKTPKSASLAAQNPISLDDSLATSATADISSSSIKFRLPEDPAPTSKRRKNRAQSTVGVGPITAAVLSRGLTAKFRSLSAWLLSDSGEDRAKTDGAESSAGLSKSYSRMSLSPFRKSQSVCHSDSFTSWATWHRLTGGTGGRKRKMAANNAESTTSDAAAASSSDQGSLNSLTDGRTPWPIPWVEAIFLPEYPNKGPVNERDFAVLSTIARGAFGKVYRVSLLSQDKDNQTVFAMKVQSKADIIGKEAMQQIKDEIAIHESLNACPFVARLYASWQSRSKLYTVLQYAMGYGDLQQLSYDFGPFSQQAVKIYAAEIATALGHVQIIDFGLARWLEPGDRTWTICGTLLYMAPEVSTGGGDGVSGYGHEVDWWCLGVIMYVLLTGRYPFPGGADHTQLTYPPYKPPTTLDTDGQTLLANLLNENPADRLQTLFDFKREPFFKDISFDDILDRKIAPFDYIPRMRHCLTCNSVNMDEEMDEDGEGRIATIDEDESISAAFDEQYFADFDYFDEKDVSGM